MYKLNNLIQFLNKYFYILPIISILSKFFKTNFYNKFKLVLKIIVYLTIITNIFVILYFTDFNSSLYLTFSLYNDLLDPYINFIKTIWNKIKIYFNIFFSEDLTNVTNNPNIKNEIKTGIKEALTEVIDDFKKDNLDIESNTNYLKPLAIVSSTIFFAYFLFYLPNSITPEDLTQYNFFNSSLIEFKINVKDFVLNYFYGGNGGNAGNTGNADNTGNVGNVSDNIRGDSHIISNNTSPNTSPINSPQITPRASSSSSNYPLFNDNFTNVTNTSVQTELNGFMISKSIKALSIINEILPIEAQNNINEIVNNDTKKIID